MARLAKIARSRPWVRRTGDVPRPIAHESTDPPAGARAGSFARSGDRTAHFVSTSYCISAIGVGRYIDLSVAVQLWLSSLLSAQRLISVGLVVVGRLQAHSLRDRQQARRLRILLCEQLRLRRQPIAPLAPASRYIHASREGEEGGRSEHAE